MPNMEAEARYQVSLDDPRRIRAQRRREEKPHSMLGYHYHNSYEVYYLVSGERYYFISDKSYHIKEGTLVLIRPYDIHCTTASEGMPYERLLVDFGEDALADLLPLLGEDESPMTLFEREVHTVSLEGESRRLVESLLRRMTDGEARGTAMPLSLLQVLLIAKQESEREHLPCPVGYLNATHRTISEVTGYINNHFAEELTLSSLAARFYVSPCYLSRIFRRYTGSSFVEYLNAVRIKEAKRLLLADDIGITRLALSVGFRSATHFGRVFKLHTGVSPLQFRRQ